MSVSYDNEKQRFVFDFEHDGAGDVVSLTGKPFDGTWFSADEFRLTLKTVGDNSDYTIDTQINAVEAAPVRTEFFSTDGRLLAEPQKGVNIVRTVRADGLIEVRKVMIK